MKKIHNAPVFRSTCLNGFSSRQRAAISFIAITTQLLILLLVPRLDLVAQNQPPKVTLKVALPNVEPLVYRDENNTPSGFQIEILREIAQKENWELTYFDGTWNECYMAIQEGQLDLIPCLSRTQEREPIFDFVEPPFYQKWTAVYIRNNEELTSITQLKGKNIGMMRGDQNASAFINYINDFNIKWQPVWYPGYGKLFDALNDHQVDAVVAHMDESSTYEKFRNAKSTGIFFKPTSITIGTLEGKLPEIRETIGRYLQQFKDDPNSNYNKHLSSPMYIMPEAQPSPLPAWGKWLLFSLGATSFALLAIVLLQRSTLFRGKMAVKTSEHTYQTMVQNLNVCLCILELKFDPSNQITDAIFITANPEYRHFHNSQRHNLKSLSFRDVHGDQAFEQWRDLFEKTYRNNKSIEFKRTEPNTGAWIGGRVVTFHDRFMTLLFTDRTEIKQNSQALIESESKFRHFFDNMTSGVIILEPVTTEKNYTITEVNKSFCDIFDLPWPKPQTLLIKEIFPLENESLNSKFADLLESTTPNPTISFSWKYGSRLFQTESFLLSENLIGAIFIEQTEEYAKQVLQTHYNEIPQPHLQSIHECLVYVNKKHDILWANNEALRYTGMSLSEIQNKNCSELNENDSIFLDKNLIDETFKTKNIVTEDEYHAPNGTIYSYASIPYLDNQGQVIYALQAFADITELRKKEEKKTQLQKMEILGRLSGGIAHDFNNILQAILGFGDLLKYKLKDSPDNLKAVQAIIDAGKHGSKLVKQLMSFSRRDQYSPTPLDLNEQIKNLTTMLHRIIGQGVSLKHTPFPSALPIYADPTQLDQAIINLCINARDAIDHSDGEIHIHSRLIEEENTSKSPLRKYIRLEITDNGHGIDPEIQPKIFDPFFTTKKNEKGTGLGLASVHDIIIRHGGWINVDSELKKGTTLSLNFPVYNYRQAPDHTRQDKTEFSPVIKNFNCCILLAEDNEKAAEFTATILENHGCKVLIANNGLEAIQAYKKHKESINLFLFDIMMPKLTGPQAYKTIVEMGGDQPVLFCSGVNLTDESIDLGSAWFLAKPFRSKQLLEKLDEILNG